MDKLVELLNQLLPFIDFFKNVLKMNENWSIFFSTSLNLTLLTGFYYLFRMVKHRVNRYNSEKKDLYPHFDSVYIKKLTKDFIHTKFQNASPTIQEDPLFSSSYAAREKLIPFFLKVINQKFKASDRFYLILADSGMGKTTFMLNLYLSFISFWNIKRNKDLKIKMLRLGFEDCLSTIKEYKREEAWKTVLLLDALDEDPLIYSKIENISNEDSFRNRVHNIIEYSRNFKIVIITCRTQYFPGQEDNPFELKIKRPDEDGFYKLNKFYISPFDDLEVKRFLNKKYPFWKFWNFSEKRKAFNIAKNSPSLMVRPMLLSYIEILVEGEDSYNMVYSVYETLIEGWLKREAHKRKKSEDVQLFINNLRNLSRQTAITIYKQRNLLRGLSLNKAQAILIAKENNIDLKPEEITGQSLLTCDSNESWKFAHKSIYEFFLAKKAIEDIEFYHLLVKSEFSGLDMVKLFYSEIGDWELINGGMFLVNNVEVKVSDFYLKRTLVTQSFWEDVTGYNPSHFTNSKNLPIENISWNEIQIFIEKLNTKTSKKHRLPSEDEWEYAAKGGCFAKENYFSGGNDLNEVAWYKDNSEDKTHIVRLKKANELGIYDMTGNVWEFVQDAWVSDNQRHIKNENGVLNENSFYVYRGGCYLDGYTRCFLSNRDRAHYNFRGNFLGFRLALDI